MQESKNPEGKIAKEINYKCKYLYDTESPFKNNEQFTNQQISNQH